VVVGPDDPEKADAITTAEVRRAEEDGVVFLGHRDDVDRLYHAMDVFVLPSYREGFPRAAMEAAACGLPVVATDVRGCRQVVDHGESGLLVPVRNAESLAAAITDLADDPDSRARMGKASAVKAESEFDEQRIVDLVLATYRQVATRKGQARLAAAFTPAAPEPARRGIPAA
jgi:glycosyltransferase involved in cell wall biosynthesis